jgi:hypothetical protein
MDDYYGWVRTFHSLGYGQESRNWLGAQRSYSRLWLKSP